MPLTPKHAARILDLDGNATLSDLRAARRRLVFAYHPDRFADAECASRHMARINAAYDTFLAHLNGQPLPSVDQKFTDGTNFKQPKPFQQASTKPRARSAAPKVPPRKAPRPQQQRPAARITTVTSTEKPSAHTPEATAFSAKISAACSSYAKALNDIGGPSLEPSIDTRVLRRVRA